MEKRKEEICSQCRHCLSCFCGDEYEDCKLKDMREKPPTEYVELCNQVRFYRKMAQRLKKENKRLSSRKEKMEKKTIVTRQELDNLFLDLMAYTPLRMVAAMLDLRLSNPISEEEVFKDLKGMFNDLCQDIADREIDESALPIGHGRHSMMLEYTGGEPALQLVIEVSEAYNEDE